MKLKEYSGINKVTLEDFLALDAEQAVRFDFLTQGEEADRTELTNSIYHKLFPWFDEKKHAGDTINTYRIAVKKYYGKYYRFLDRKTQLEIIGIIKKCTPHNEGQIFEFEETDKNGKPYYQLCNNYQLGNFFILPVQGGINPKRAQEPYNDFFNGFLNVLSDFYNNNDFKKTDKLKEAILSQKDYFKRFDSITDFLDKNYLWSFTKRVAEDTIPLQNLSDKATFEEYVLAITDIIKQRGKELYDALKVNDNQSIADKSQANAKKYSLDENTAIQLTKMDEYRKVEEKYESIAEQYQRTSNKVNADFDSQISAEQARTFSKKLIQIRWWRWPLSWLVIQALKIILPIRNFMGVINKIFWIVLVVYIIYYFVYQKKFNKFQEDKDDKIKNLNEEKNQEINMIKNECQEKLDIFYKIHESEFNFASIIPSEYQGANDVTQLVSFVETKRADNFKEAYELLENLKHHQMLEEQARRSAEAAEREAEYKRQAAERETEYKRQVAQAKIENSERQAEEARNRSLMLEQQLMEQNQKLAEQNKQLEEINQKMKENNMN